KDDLAPNCRRARASRRRFCAVDGRASGVAILRRRNDAAAGCEGARVGIALRSTDGRPAQNRSVIPRRATAVWTATCRWRLLPGGSCAGVVLLDEPWEGLDPNGSAWLTETLGRCRDEGAGLLISSHRFHDLDSVCTRFVMLEKGRCVPITAQDHRPRVEQLVQA